MNENNHALIHKAAGAVSPKRLTTGKLRALKALISQGPKDTMSTIADKAGVSVRTLHRYMVDTDFRNELRERSKDLLEANRAAISAALVRAAKSPGASQTPAIKLYFQLLGDLVNRNEVSGPDGGTIRVEGNLDVALLSGPVRQLILVEIDGGTGYLTAGERDALAAIATRAMARLERQEKPIDVEGKLVRLIPKDATPDEVAL
jgi:hypothetical protein